MVVVTYTVVLRTAQYSTGTAGCVAGCGITTVLLLYSLHKSIYYWNFLLNYGFEQEGRFRIVCPEPPEARWPGRGRGRGGARGDAGEDSGEQRTERPGLLAAGRARAGNDPLGGEGGERSLA